MKVLAIESSAVTASVAIMTEDTLIAEYTINYKKTHSQTLLPMIDEICRMTENNAADCDIIAVSNGPGSFTGLRIGAATGKGLALALDKPMVAVPTLEAMAYNFYGDDRIICPVMDARRAHLYSGLYRFENGKLITVHEQCLISYGELAGILNEVKEKVVFVGDGIAAAKDYFKDNLTCNYTFSPAGLRTQRASSVALAAIDMANEGKTIGSDMLKPDYLRPSQAEREHSGKRAYHIRPMEDRDISTVEQIEKSIFSLPWSAKSFADAANTPENVYLVCECTGEIAGYCGMWTVLGEGNITNIAVSPSYRRSGVAEALLKELERRARLKDVTIFFLEVRQSNEAAKRLYEKLGYSPIGVRKRFYEKPVEDAIVMSKS